jgi:chemotaxis-related protein WspD
LLTVEGNLMMTHDNLTNGATRPKTQGINQLLNRPHPEGYRSDLTRRFAQAQQEKFTDEYTSLLFRVGVEWLALPAERIREIAVIGALHKLPHRHNALLGLTNVRGELLICVELAAFLEISQIKSVKDSNPYTQLLIVTTDQGPLAFPVNTVHGFHTYQGDDLKALPSTLSGVVNTYTYSILHWQGHSVGCLDAQALLRAINQSLS